MVATCGYKSIYLGSLGDLGKLKTGFRTGCSFLLRKFPQIQ